MFVPIIFSTLRGYDRVQLASDAVAGIIVGIVALPLAIAFAIASGVTPGRGLWTAIIAGFLISAFGGSRVQIGGPTGAFVVIVYGIVQKFGIDGLTVATLMAGVILVVMGLVKFGDAIRFIPHPLVTGFTSGIAIIILSSQVKDFFGLQMGDVPANFMAKWQAYAHAATGVSPAALAVALLALAIILLWPRISTRIPGPFVALIVTTAVVRLLHVPVETIGSRFGEISASIPHPTLPHLSFEQTTALVGPAFTIALLAAVESLLSAVVADGMIGSQHKSNVELVAQGMANIASPLFGGIPATGAIARTATNVKNGGRTPVAGIVHSLTLLLITLFFGRWASLIPMATLAAILVVVAYHMSEWRSFLGELTSPKSDVVVLLTTFTLTVLVDLTVAIEVGMVLAAFLFMRRMSAVASVSQVTHDLTDDFAVVADGDELLDRRIVPPGVEVYEISGPFFFGAAQAFRDTLGRVAGRPKVLIIRMRHVPAMDSTGMRSLRDVVQRSRKDGTVVLLAELHSQPLQALRATPTFDEIGMDNFCPSLDFAFARAREVLLDR
ncbi:MAG: sulfate transporter [Gemmatimonadetes bacterium]|nr:sulfate transporter [Gemmatimonadota bacterium]